MEPLTNKQKEIITVADRLFAETGVKPSVRAIREEIGGSNTTINDAMKLWRSQHEITAAEVQAAPNGVTEALVGVSGKIWKTASELADRAYQEFKAKADAARANAETERDDAFAELDEATAKILELGLELTTVKRALEQQQVESERQAKAKAALQTQFDTLSGRFTQLETDNHALLEKIESKKAQ